MSIATPPNSSGDTQKTPVASHTLAEPTIHRGCPVCATADHSRLYCEANYDLSRLNDFAFASRKLPENMHLRLHECSRCDMLYASPVFEKDVLASAYRAAAYDSVSISEFAAQTYGRFLPGLISRIPDRNGALDVGAGDGAFVGQLVRHGFTNAIGVEPSLAAIAEAPPEIKPLMRTGFFNVTDFPAESLSLVTCFQTIEHVDAPLKFCSDAWQLLRPGGALFLIGHNRRALSARILGRKSPIFDIEHLQLFSPRSIAELLHAAGFQNVRVSMLWNSYPLSYWTRLFPLPGRIKHGLIRLLDKSGMGRIRFALPAGNIAAIGFKP